MLHPSTKKLIDRLIAMTAERKIDWREGEGGRVSYTTEGYSVALEKEPTDVVITTADGRELERATAEEIADVPDDADVSYTDQVASMTRDATRKAKGIDEAISTLLAGIGPDDGGIPDLPVETLEADIAEANDIIEDVGDESAVVSAQDDEADVETVDTATSSTELTSEEIDSESENVTEAVARLADEVNGREAEEDSSDDAAEEITPQIDGEISLSGLGAGFGLGTLQAKNALSNRPITTAEDTPITDDVMETTLASNDDTPLQEKVVIDAIDDIELDDAVTDEMLVDSGIDHDAIAVADIGADDASETATSVDDMGDVEDEGADDSASTTSKTKFNPWT